MQQREKYLGIGLGSIVLLYFGLPIFESTFLEPLKALEVEEERLQEEANAKFDSQIELKKQEKKLVDWRRISLPPDPLNAQRLYQEWLIDLAQLSGFEEIKVTLERRVAQGKDFVTIPVTLEAKATIQELAQFLERFESVDLLHRISTCDAVSPASEGNPDLQVTLTAEGLSLTTASNRSRLFPQIVLESDLKKNQTKLEFPTGAFGFPKSGEFRIRIDQEFVNVTKVSGKTWQLQRGIAKTFAVDHPLGATVELFPMTNDFEIDPNAVEAMWSQSLFAKPAPQASYDPKLATTTAPPAVRGQNWNWKLNVTSWNPAFGSPMFTLLEGPEALKLDERTGTLAWKVDSNFDVGPQTLQVMVWGSASKEAGFTATVNLRVRDPNKPPVIAQEGPLRFFLGRTSRKKIEGSDPDGGVGGQLKYTLQGAPAGMQIGERDGVITWSPAESMEEQSLEIQVTVTDSDEDPESVTRTIPVLLEEDSARYTFLTTTFKREFGEGVEEWEAYLFDRATNKTTLLKTGSKVTIADFEMTIDKIGDESVEVTRPDGKYRIVFERPLVDMIPFPSTGSTVPGDAAAATALPTATATATDTKKETETPATTEPSKLETPSTPVGTPDVYEKPLAPGSVPEKPATEEVPVSSDAIPKSDDATTPDTSDASSEN